MRHAPRCSDGAALGTTALPRATGVDSARSGERIKPSPAWNQTGCSSRAEMAALARSRRKPHSAQRRRLDSWAEGPWLNRHREDSASAESRQPNLTRGVPFDPDRQHPEGVLDDLKHRASEAQLRQRQSRRSRSCSRRCKSRTSAICSRSR